MEEERHPFAEREEKVYEGHHVEHQDRPPVHAEEKKLDQHHVHHDSPKKTAVNRWAVVSVVLGVLLIVSVFSDGFSFVTGQQSSALSKEEASAKTVTFVNENLLQGQAVAQIVSIEDEGNLYNIKLSVSGEQVDSYVTKDGNLFFPQAINLNEAPSASSGSTPPPPEVVKSDRPTVELFVMSHCPYGTQAEKGILPIVNLLGEKIDFSIKFVSYAMHGKNEVDEELNQYCIQKEQPEVFSDYLECFLSAGEGETCLADAGVNVAKMKSCVDKADKEFKVTELYNDQSTWSGGRYPQFNIYKTENELYSVRGSPTLVINGQEASSGRSPAEYLATICNAFNEAPEECTESTGVSTATFSPGFGYEEGTATAASCG